MRSCEISVPVHKGRLYLVLELVFFVHATIRTIHGYSFVPSFTFVIHICYYIYVMIGSQMLRKTRCNLLSNLRRLVGCTHLNFNIFLTTWTCDFIICMAIYTIRIYAKIWANWDWVISFGAILHAIDIDKKRFVTPFLTHCETFWKLDLHRTSLSATVATLSLNKHNTHELIPFTLIRSALYLLNWNPLSLPLPKEASLDWWCSLLLLLRTAEVIQAKSKVRF